MATHQITYDSSSNLRLRLPRNRIVPTQARSAEAHPKVCNLYLGRGCNFKAQCKQVHPDIDFLQRERAERSGKMSCCMRHGDRDSDEEAREGLPTLQPESLIRYHGTQTIDRESCCYTKSLYEFYRNDNHLPSPMPAAPASNTAAVSDDKVPKPPSITLDDIPVVNSGMDEESTKPHSAKLHGDGDDDCDGDHQGTEPAHQNAAPPHRAHGSRIPDAPPQGILGTAGDAAAVPSPSSPPQDLRICTSHILGVGCMYGCDCKFLHVCTQWASNQPHLIELVKRHHKDAKKKRPSGGVGYHHHPVTTPSQTTATGPSPVGTYPSTSSSPSSQTGGGHALLGHAHSAGQIRVTVGGAHGSSPMSTASSQQRLGTDIGASNGLPQLYYPTNMSPSTSERSLFCHSHGQPPIGYSVAAHAMSVGGSISFEPHGGGPPMSVTQNWPQASRTAQPSPANQSTASVGASPQPSFVTPTGKDANGRSIPPSPLLAQAAAFGGNASTYPSPYMPAAQGTNHSYFAAGSGQHHMGVAHPSFPTQHVYGLHASAPPSPYGSLVLPYSPAMQHHHHHHHPPPPEMMAGSHPAPSPPGGAYYLVARPPPSGPPHQGGPAYVHMHPAGSMPSYVHSNGASSPHPHFNLQPSSSAASAAPPMMMPLQNYHAHFNYHGAPSAPDTTPSRQPPREHHAGTPPQPHYFHPSSGYMTMGGPPGPPPQQPVAPPPSTPNYAVASHAQPHPVPPSHPTQQPHSQGYTIAQPFFYVQYTGPPPPTRDGSSGDNDR